MTKYLTNNYSLINLHKKPSTKSEIVTQIIFGQSFSIFRGIKKSKYNNIVTIDGDGQNNPSDIINLLNLYFSSESIKLVGGIRKIENAIQGKLNKQILDIEAPVAEKLRAHIQ